MRTPTFPVYLLKGARLFGSEGCMWVRSHSYRHEATQQRTFIFGCGHGSDWQLEVGSWSCQCWRVKHQISTVFDLSSTILYLYSLFFAFYFELYRPCPPRIETFQCELFWLSPLWLLFRCETLRGLLPSKKCFKVKHQSEVFRLWRLSTFHSCKMTS